MAAQRYFVAWEKDVSRESWLIWSGPKFSLSLSSFLSVSSSLEKKDYFRTFSHGALATLSNDNVWNWGNEGCFSVFDRYIYIYIWGELRAEFYGFCFLWKICTRWFRNTRLHVSNSHVSIEFFDINFYFIRVIQLFIQLFCFGYNLFFFATLREGFKIYPSHVLKRSLFDRIFARLKNIYIFIMFMNIYLKNCPPIYFNLYPKCNYRTIKFVLDGFEIIVATFSNILRLIEFSCNWNIPSPLTNFLFKYSLSVFWKKKKKIS